MTFISCKPVSDVKTSPIRFQVVRFRDNDNTCLWNFATSVSLYFASSRGASSLCTQRPNELFWKRLGQRTFIFVGGLLEQRRIKKFCVFLVLKFQMLQPFRHLNLRRNGSAVCTVTWFIVCWWRQVNQSRTVGNRRWSLLQESSRCNK